LSPSCSVLLLAKTIMHPAARSLCDSWASCSNWWPDFTCLDLFVTFYYPALVVRMSATSSYVRTSASIFMTILSQMYLLTRLDLIKFWKSWTSDHEHLKTERLQLCCIVYCLPLHTATYLAAATYRSLELFIANGVTVHPIITVCMLTLQGGHFLQFGLGRVVHSPECSFVFVSVKKLAFNTVFKLSCNDAVFLSLLCTTWLLYNCSSQLLSELISRDRKCTKTHWTLRWGNWAQFTMLVRLLMWLCGEALKVHDILVHFVAWK